MGFQFFGTSVSDSDGNYMFRTIIPGKYEPRPRHIHVKIRKDGRELLTSQIYFSVDGETAGVGGSTRNLRMELKSVENSDGSISYSGNFDFIVDIGVTGN
jgi:protocatechuate 3,4-dioxygenase beta subunit